MSENCVENYGNLSEKELYEFLSEIESDDDSLDEIEAEASKIIESEEAVEDLTILDSSNIADDNEDLEKGLEDSDKAGILTEDQEERQNREIEAQYGEKAWWGLEFKHVHFSPQHRLKNGSVENLNKGKKERRVKLKEERIAIQREAFNQTFIDLSSEITPDNMKLLISELVAEHTKMIDRYRAFINKRLTVLLKPFIPRLLKLCKTKYPSSVRVSPGFLYQASKDFGDSLTFWASPDIPYFFEQNSETEILRTSKAYWLTRVDRCVVQFHYHSRTRADKELKYASMLYLKRVRTYFDLLKLNPFWFNKLYKKLIENNECERTNTQRGLQA